MRKLALIEILIVLSAFAFFFSDSKCEKYYPNNFLISKCENVRGIEDNVIALIVGTICLVTIIIGLIINSKFRLVSLLSTPVIPAIIAARYSDPHDWLIDGGSLLAFVLSVLYVTLVLFVLAILSSPISKVDTAA